MPNFEDYIYNDQKDSDVVETVILKEKQISFGAMAEEYRILWDTLNVRQSRIGEIDAVVDRIHGHEARYNTVAQATNIPWYVVAVIHYLESDLDFSVHLHNKDPLTGYTINEPTGRLKTHEPPFTWEESAIDALTYDGLSAISDWSIEKIAYQLEAFNGFGYRRHHPNVKSPYLWSFSNHYEKGRYIGDRHWSEESVSDQCGAMVLICQMIARNIIVSPHMDGDAPFAATHNPVTEPTSEIDNGTHVNEEISSAVEVAESEADSAPSVEENSEVLQTLDEAATSDVEDNEAVSSETIEIESEVTGQAMAHFTGQSETTISELAQDVGTEDNSLETEASLNHTEASSETENDQASEQPTTVESAEVEVISDEAAAVANLVAENTNVKSVSPLETDTSATQEEASTSQDEASTSESTSEDNFEQDSIVSEEPDNGTEEPELNSESNEPARSDEAAFSPEADEIDAGNEGVLEMTEGNTQEPGVAVAEFIAETETATNEPDAMIQPEDAIGSSEPEVISDVAHLGELTVHEEQEIDNQSQQNQDSLDVKEGDETVLETEVSIPEWLQAARGEIGTRDFPGPFYEPRIFAYLQTTLQNPNNDETSWSSAFVNWCMFHSGHSGTNDTNARTWLNYGDVLNEPKLGCIVVLWKGHPESRTGHVGFFDGFEGNRIRLLGAHSGGGVDWEEVYVASLPAERVLGYRWPRDHKNELIQAPLSVEQGSDPEFTSH